MSRMPANGDKQGRFVNGQSGNTNGSTNIFPMLMERAELIGSRVTTAEELGAK